MSAITKSSARRRAFNYNVLVLVLATFTGLVVYTFTEDKKRPLPVELERDRSGLQLRENKLFDGELPFTGTVIERYPDGVLRSRSSVSNGLLQGLSQGWYTNGQLQVTEHFVAGVSHGLRSKWYPDGAKLSDATIANGKLDGRFQRWHENGTLSEQIDFSDGRPEGVSLAWFPSGSPKARVVTRAGQTIERESWSDGKYGL